MIQSSCINKYLNRDKLLTKRKVKAVFKYKDVSGAKFKCDKCMRSKKIFFEDEYLLNVTTQINYIAFLKLVVNNNVMNLH